MFLWIEAIIVAAVAFLAGYVLGRKIGTSDGFRTGVALSPLELRQKSLEQGACLICGSEPKTGMDKQIDEVEIQEITLETEGVDSGVEDLEDARTGE